MTTYYKATRPDGTDFRTGKLLHEVGKTVKHPEPSSWPILNNEPFTYLSTSIEPAETLIGGSWPCRLFTVEPIGTIVARTDGHHTYKRGMKAYRVLEERPAHEALGPNGAEVAALIERLRLITAAEYEDLRAAYDRQGCGAAWDAAWDAAWYAAWYAAFRECAPVALRRYSYVDCGLERRSSPRGAAWHAAMDAVWRTARDTVWRTAQYATAALVVRDCISDKHFNTLYGPWQSVMGE